MSTSKYFEDRAHLQDIYISRDIADMFYSNSDSNYKGAFLMGVDGDILDKKSKEVDEEEKKNPKPEKKNNPVNKNTDELPDNTEDSEDSEDSDSNENSDDYDNDEELTPEEEAQDILDIDKEETGEATLADAKSRQTRTQESKSEDDNEDDENLEENSSNFDDLWEEK